MRGGELSDACVFEAQSDGTIVHRGSLRRATRSDVESAGAERWECLRGVQRCVCRAGQEWCDVFRQRGGATATRERCVFREVQSNGTVVRRTMCLSSGAERCVRRGGVERCVFGRLREVCRLGRRTTFVFKAQSDGTIVRRGKCFSAGAEQRESLRALRRACVGHERSEV